MGDRANFGSRLNGEILYLYGHWAGGGMLGSLADALDVARPRWDDDSYGTRIVFSQLIGTDWNQEYGWGFSVNRILDNEHSIPIIDWQAQTVTLYESFEKTPTTVKFTMGFEAFVNKFSTSRSVV